MSDQESKINHFTNAKMELSGYPDRDSVYIDTFCIIDDRGLKFYGVYKEIYINDGTPDVFFNISIPFFGINNKGMLSENFNEAIKDPLFETRYGSYFRIKFNQAEIASIQNLIVEFFKGESGYKIIAFREYNKLGPPHEVIFADNWVWFPE